MEKTKVCSKCGQEKLLSAFYKRSDRINGYASWCKQCSGIYAKEHRSKLEYNIPDNKKCSKCGEIKPSSEFNVDKNKKSKLTSQCKKCINESATKKRHTLKETTNTVKVCGMCGKEKPITDFCKNNGSPDGFHNRCKQCRKIKHKEYYAENREDIIKKNRIKYNNNKDEINEKARIWYAKNKTKISKQRKLKYNDNKKEYNKRYRELNADKLREYRCIYERDRTKNDELYAFKKYIRSHIGQCFKRKYMIKGIKTEDILGCTIDFFKEYIESKFIEGMTWDNRGEWHLDHIVALATAKTEEDVIKLCHYTNYQPLWMSDNCSKRDTIPDQVQFKLL